MGGLFGGGGGGGAQPATSTTPGTGQVYTPQAQPSADVLYQNLVNQMYNMGLSNIQQMGAVPQQQTYPQVQGIAQTQAAPGQAYGTYGPYADQAMQAAQQAYGIGQNTLGAVAPGIPQLASLAQQFPGLGLNYGQQVANLGQPFTQLGQQYGGQVGNLAQTLGGIGQTAAAQTQAAMPALQNLQAMMPGAAQQILQTSMDPQQALYNRTAQQTLDQTRAINAMSGVGTSPYGAGVAAQNMANFNLNWQNQQLQRQLQGIVGAGQAGQTASQLGGQLGNLAGLAENQQITAPTAQASLLGQALGLQQTGATTAANLFGSGLGLMGQGANQAASLYGSALGLGGQAGQLAQQTGALPYQTSTQQAQNAINALNQQTQLGQSSFTLPQAVLNDIQSYLGLGQSASNLAGQLGSLSSQQMASNLAGIGLLGGLGSNALFGTSGLSGALGLGSGGLLGGLTGAGAGAAGAGAGLSGLGAAMSGDVAASTAAGSGAGKGLGALALA